MGHIEEKDEGKMMYISILSSSVHSLGDARGTICIESCDIPVFYMRSFDFQSFVDYKEREKGDFCAESMNMILLNPLLTVRAEQNDQNYSQKSFHRRHEANDAGLQSNTITSSVLPYSL